MGKNKNIHIRLSNADYGIIKMKADVIGTSISDFIRSLCLEYWNDRFDENIHTKMQERNWYLDNYGVDITSPKYEDNPEQLAIDCGFMDDVDL